MESILANNLFYPTIFPHLLIEDEYFLYFT